MPLVAKYFFTSKAGCSENCLKFKMPKLPKITDAGNQTAWLVYSRYPFDPTAPSIERCLTLCAIPHALCPFLLARATRNAQPRSNIP
jgi:hypothetical protein